MGEATGRFTGGRQLAIAAAYAACYVLLRSVSTSHWNLPAGLRLACLLLVPTRYWPALIVGEFIPVGYHAWNCRDEFGWQWALLTAIPPIAPLAMLVAWCQHRSRLFRGDHQINMIMLLGVTMLAGLLAAVCNAAILSTVQMSGHAAAPAVTAQVVFGYFLGNYLGALTLVPAVLALYLWLTESPGAHSEATLWQSHLARDCVIGVLVPLLTLMGLVLSSHGDSMQVLRIAMFLPVVWLTSRHGWQGAALGGMLASMAVATTSTMVRDPEVIQAQALMAFAITTLLMLGSRIAHQTHSAQSSQVDTLRGFQLAQQGLYLEELRLRQAADTLEHIGQNIRENHNRLLDRLRHVLPANEERAYSRQAAITQHEMHRLANALYPRGWRERGVPATLREGPFAQAVGMAGASYRCELSGRGLSQLAPDVHMALYRLACEVLIYVLSRGQSQHIHLQVRGGHTGGQRWVVMRLVGKRGSPGDDATAASAESWKQAMTLLGASGLGIASIRDRAQIYGGYVHLRDLPDGMSVTLLLRDSLRAFPLHRGASA
ncbi:MASE1 domain-containing protein [Dyella humicola]|uniref:MASE1 domain-containing protein n=1 Tax=Dyella humicola TaxID=2992126 RepID=UPI002255BAA8|nr:MASE1 domain-containing protein [Dyella humicola]